MDLTLSTACLHGEALLVPASYPISTHEDRRVRSDKVLVVIYSLRIVIVIQSRDCGVLEVSNGISESYPN